VARPGPITARADLAARLEVRRGTALLRMPQTDYDGDDQPVLYSEEYHLPDAFFFLVNHKGPHW
jgi:GntR family transcriptional regulator